MEGTGAGQISFGCNRQWPEAGVPTSENPTGGQGCPALPLAGGPEVKVSGDITVHKGTARVGPTAILARRSDPAAPVNLSSCTSRMRC